MQLIFHFETIFHNLKVLKMFVFRWSAHGLIVEHLIAQKKSSKSIFILVIKTDQKTGQWS